MKKKKKARNEVGEGSVKIDEAEESNTWKRSKPVNMVKSDCEPVPGVKRPLVGLYYCPVFLP